jgi:ankyrin repeat protein
MPLVRTTYRSFVLLTVLVGCTKTESPENARKELGSMNVPYSEEAFIESAKNGDITAVNLFLRSGMNPNARDPMARLALVYARPEKPSSNMQYYIDAKKKHQADPLTKDIVTDKGMTPLMAAATMGRTEIVRTLLAKGADPNAKDNFGWTALIYAAWQGHTDTVAALLKGGAEVNISESREQELTPLHVAIGSGNLDVVQLLLNSGADVNKPHAGDTALIRAAKEGNKDIVRAILAKEVDLNAQDFFGNTALSEAVDDEQVEIVQMLLESGVDVNVHEEMNGLTPLMYAARDGNKIIVQMLLAKGAEVNSKGTSGQTALRFAEFFRHPEVSLLLKQAGAK